MATSEGLIAVVPQRSWFGLESLDRFFALESGAPVRPISLVPFREAFERRWETDAHLVCYGVDPWDAKEDFYRLNKASLASIQAQGGRVVILYLGLDWDTGKKPNHVPWTPELWRSFQEKLALGQAQNPLFRQVIESVAVSYTTLKGYRWVFRLTVPILPEQAEVKIQGLLEMFASVGIEVDPQCCDWTRLFRLPRVKRDDYYTDDFSVCPFFVCDFSETTLPAELIPDPVGPAKVSLPAVPVDATQPDEEAADALLWVRTGRNSRKTEFQREAEKMLKGKDYYPFLFEMLPLTLADNDSRHKILLKWSASTVCLLYSNVAGVTPAHIYALFYKPLCGLPPERDWHHEVWRAILWAWGKEEAQKVQEAVKVQQVQVEVIEAGDSIVKGVRQWNLELSSSPLDAWNWIQRRMVVLSGDTHFVLDRRGFYSFKGVSQRGLVPQVRHLGMGEFIQTRVETQSGGTRPANYNEIMAAYGVVANEEVSEPEIDGGYLRNVESVNPTFVTLSYRLRRDLEPCFHPGVDGWIRQVGQEKYEFLNRHIGCLFNFKYPVAAINFIASHSSGKTLLVRGCVETLERPHLATARDLSEDFNTGLLRSPFLWANEGAQLKWGMYHPGDTFRMLVTGDDVSVNRKHAEQVMTCNKMRVFFTANNKNLILQLCADRDLAPEDRDAIAVRLVSYMPEGAPSDYLRAQGGRKFTEGWIRSDEFVVARHFLHLYETYGRNAQPYGEHGLLVSGEVGSSIIEDMQVQGGSTPVVIEALAGLLRRIGKVPGSWMSGVRVERGRFRVTASAVLNYWRENQTKGSSERLNVRRVSNSLKGLVVGGKSHKQMIEGQQANWHDIDIRLLEKEINWAGWEVPNNIRTLLGMGESLDETRATAIPHPEVRA